MKALGISFAVGLLVGVLYGVIRVKSPAPPIVALLGLLGMVLGEQFGEWVIAKKIQPATNVSIVSRHNQTAAFDRTSVGPSGHTVGEGREATSDQQTPNPQ